MWNWVAAPAPSNSWLYTSSRFKLIQCNLRIPTRNILVIKNNELSIEFTKASLLNSKYFAFSRVERTASRWRRQVNHQLEGSGTRRLARRSRMQCKSFVPLSINLICLWWKFIFKDLKLIQLRRQGSLSSTSLYEYFSPQSASFSLLKT